MKMNQLNKITDMMNNYKKCDKQETTYRYHDLVYQKNRLQGISVFAFLNVYLVIAIIIVHGILFGSIFGTPYWWLPYVVIILFLIVLPIITFEKATQPVRL